MLFGTLYSSTRTFITSSNVSKIKWPLTKEVPLSIPHSPLPHPLLGREDEVINDEDDVCTVVVKRAGS
jgi:hypothetical protein